jgi:hypothetical protein
MGALGVIGDEVIVQHLLHLVKGLEPCAPTFDAEVFVEKGAVEAFDDAVRLGPLDARGAVFDILGEVRGRFPLNLHGLFSYFSGID